MRLLLLVLTILLVTAAGASAAITPRVVGGTGATQNYPAQAEVDVSAGASQELCGGTLIDPQWVLTAQHCVDQQPLLLGPAQELPASAFTVKLGSATLDAGTPYAVDGVARWEGFDFQTLEHDAALLHLSSAAPEQPLDLLNDATLPAALPGTPARVIGWGYTSENGSVSRSLMQVDVPIQTDSACHEAYGDGVDTDTMLCAGLPGGGKDACNGDSGGPLMVATGGGLVLAGIVSFGNGCAEPDAYGVYTRVANAGFRQWVSSVVPSVAAAQARGAELSMRKAALSAASCGRRACHVRVAFATAGTASARVKVSPARRAALSLHGRTVAAGRGTVTGSRRLTLKIPSGTRRKLGRGGKRQVPAVMTVSATTATGVGEVRRFHVMVKASR